MTSVPSDGALASWHSWTISLASHPMAGGKKMRYGGYGPWSCRGDFLVITSTKNHPTSACVLIHLKRLPSYSPIQGCQWKVQMSLWSFLFWLTMCHVSLPSILGQWHGILHSFLVSSQVGWIISLIFCLRIRKSPPRFLLKIFTRICLYKKGRSP